VLYLFDLLLGRNWIANALSTLRKSIGRIADGLVRAPFGDTLAHMSESPSAAPLPSPNERATPLKTAIRRARIEAAVRTGVVVDLRDAELARLEILNEALEPVFADVPAGIDLFDRGITPGEPPRLWIDMIAHVVMGPDKHVYRFVQDTRHGRRVLVESPQVNEIVAAVANYLARRLIERERALGSDPAPARRELYAFATVRRRRRLRGLGLFALGALLSATALLAAAWWWPGAGH
jgi:hypothetical protein